MDHKREIIKKKNNEREPKISRRKFLKLLGSGLVIGLGSYFLLSKLLKLLFSKKEEDRKTLKEILEEINKGLSELENNKEFDPSQNLSVNLSEKLKKFIESNSLGGLIGKYFVFDNKNEINPYFILDNLWEEKIGKVEEEFKENFRKLKIEILEDYEENPGKRIDLREFFNNYLNNCLIESLSIIDIDKLSRRFELSQEKMDILKIILEDSKFYRTILIFLSLIILNEISYASKDNPEINLEILNYLISNFGINFISCIPSIYDERISFGPFQLTDIVVGENNTKRSYPISIINECLKDEFENYYKLPNNLKDFRKRHHYRGVIFLCIYNLCRYLKKLNENQLFEIENLIKNKRENFYYNLILILAASHHGGEGVIKEFLKPENEREFSENVKNYLERIKINYEILRKWIGEA